MNRPIGMLTATADNLTGTADDDTFGAVLDSTTAANTTLSAADQIDGAAGTDTLAITLQGGVTANVPAADVTDVENVSVRNVSAGATAIDGSSMVGAEQFINDRSTADVTFNSIGSADVTIQGNSVVTHGATNIDVGATAVTDAFTLNIKDGVKGGVIDVADTEADWTEATVNSTGAANTVGAVNLSGNGAGNAGTHTIKTLNVNAVTNLTTGQLTGFAADASVVISGIAEQVALGLGNTADNVDSIDASGLTGGVKVTLDSETDTQFVGGQGNDVVTTGATYVAADEASIDAGAGSADRLVVNAAANVGTVAAGAKYQGFEVVQTDGQNLDLDNLSGIDAIVAKGTVTLDNVTAEQAENIVINGGSTPTINVAGATTVGQLDSISLTADDEAAATSTITLGNVIAAGVESAAFEAVDNLTISSVAGLSDADSFSFSGAGDLNVTFDAATLANTKIDASEATGAVTINASTATGTNGVEIVGGGSKVNTLTGTANADKITGADGDDVLTGGAGDDVLTGGAGADTFVVADVTAAGTDTITDFGSDDVVKFAAITDYLDATGTDFDTGNATLADALADVSVAAKTEDGTDSTGWAVTFEFDGKAYAYVDGATDGYTAGDDAVIQLTGTDATSLTADNFIA